MALEQGFIFRFAQHQEFIKTAMGRVAFCRARYCRRDPLLLCKLEVDSLQFMSLKSDTISEQNLTTVGNCFDVFF